MPTTLRVTAVFKDPRRKGDHPSLVVRWPRREPEPAVLADLAAIGWKTDGLLGLPPPPGLAERVLLPRPGSLLFGRLTPAEALDALNAAVAVLNKHGLG